MKSRFNDLGTYLEFEAAQMRAIGRAFRLDRPQSHNHVLLSGCLSRAVGLPAITGAEPAAGASSQPPTEPPPGAVASNGPPARAG